MATPTMKCLVCERGDLEMNESRRQIEVDGKLVDVPFRMHSCTECGTVQGLDEDLRFNARAMRRATKQVRNLLTGERVREIRKRLCLTQEQAATLFGGGPVAFSKYENDEISQSDSMDRLLWIVNENPWLVGELAERVNVSLSHDTFVLVQQSLVEYREEYMNTAKERVCNAHFAFDGFLRCHHSRIEKVYRPREGARTELRRAA